LLFGVEAYLISFPQNKHGNLSPAQVEDARYIYDGGHELLELINDVMDLSKVEAGKLDVYLEKVYIDDIAKNLENQFKPVAQEKALQFMVNIADSLPQYFTTDSKRLVQILKNFLSNAFKFSAKGDVVLSIFKAGKDTKISREGLVGEEVIGFSVQDFGIGIPAEKQKDIFEAFQQQDGSTSRKYGGTGLGLSIARQLASLLRGEITLSSTFEVGSTFTLYLSLNQSNVEQNTEDMVTAGPQPNISNHTVSHMNVSSSGLPIEMTADLNFLAGRQVLLVDDNMRNLFALSKQLEEFGMQIVLAADGQQAINKLQDHSVDIILMDIMMPVMDGFEAIQKIRQMTKFKDIPIIATTANAMSDDRAKCMDSGASDYMTKPIEIHSLMKMFGTWLKSTS